MTRPVTDISNHVALGQSAHKVAILIPCKDEVAAIGNMVSQLKKLLPKADIYVYDNNSTDGTAEAATKAGAIVRAETRQGKGFVVRRMFADIEA
ncbi:MAG: glycosyltransferase, partial [Pseudomonadota bacterium]